MKHLHVKGGCIKDNSVKPFLNQTERTASMPKSSPYQTLHCGLKSTNSYINDPFKIGIPSKLNIRFHCIVIISPCVFIFQVWEAKTLVQKHLIPGLHHWVRALALNPDRVNTNNVSMFFVVLAF